MRQSSPLSHIAYVVKTLGEHWQPHDGQKKIGRALFREFIKGIFVQCGRKWGKTEFGLYVLYRWGMTFPGLPCFYVAPELKQAKKIVWEDPRVQNFGPPEWKADINNSDMRIRLINGSYIKIDGSDNYESHRGTRPGIVVYEEYKDHDPKFRAVMRPNLAVYEAPEVFLGTPPDREGEFTETAKEHKDDPKKMFYQAPTWENPRISREWLFDEKKRLYLRGEGDVWEREFEAKFIPGGSSKIFPMWGESFVRPHEEILQLIKRDRKKLIWYVWADPAGASCFAVLFAALNPYSKVWYVLDEIYEKRQSHMTVSVVGTDLLQKRDELWDREWNQGYDEAATWFANEMRDIFDENFVPSHKHLNEKEVGLTLMKDIMLQGKILVSDRAKHFYSEVDNYYKDKNGNIPKKNDHLIDDFRYILGDANYQLDPELPAEYRERKAELERGNRGSRIDDDFPVTDDMADTNYSVEEFYDTE